MNGNYSSSPEEESATGRPDRDPPATQDDPANRLDADCAPRRGCEIIPVIVIHRQEVRPMYAVSVMGAPLQGRIARLR
jgi:hypothetical protein